MLTIGNSANFWRKSCESYRLKSPKSAVRGKKGSLLLSRCIAEAIRSGINYLTTNFTFPTIKNIWNYSIVWCSICVLFKRKELIYLSCTVQNHISPKLKQFQLFSKKRVTAIFSFPDMSSAKKLNQKNKQICTVKKHSSKWKNVINRTN